MQATNATLFNTGRTTLADKSGDKPLRLVDSSDLEYNDSILDQQQLKVFNDTIKGYNKVMPPHELHGVLIYDKPMDLSAAPVENYVSSDDESDFEEDVFIRSQTNEHLRDEVR